MKNLRLHFILFCPMFFISCHEGFSNHPGGSGKSPQISILIYQYYLEDHPTAHNWLSVNFFVINNSDDTIKYTSTDCLFSRFFCSNIPNTTAVDWTFPTDSVERIVIPPHDGKSVRVTFKIKTVPYSTFSFKIGMKFPRWYSGNTRDVLAVIAREKQDTIWSNSRPIKINHNRQVSDPANEQYQANILKRVTPVFLPRLTRNDRSNYTLSINPSKTKRLDIPNDTVINYMYLPSQKRNNCRYFMCEVTIRNNSRGTLKYLSMTCSWRDFYKTNDADIKVLGSMCIRNFPEDRVIPPQQSSVVDIPIVMDAKTILPKKIKIGLSLQKCTDCDAFEMPSELLEQALKPQPYNMLWSNAVTIN